MANAVGNPFKQLQNLVGKPSMIPADIANMKHLSSDDKQLLKKIGMTFQQLKTDILKDTQIQWDRQTMYQNVSRALNHWLVSCLRGNTKIRLCSGESISIKEMAENSAKYIGKYTWSVNPKTLSLEVDKIVAVQKTRKNAQLVRVHLDNNKHIDCTPDHKFMNRDGSYTEAQNLKSNDSLMSMSISPTTISCLTRLWVEAREAEEAMVNHKVVKVEWLSEREDTYDISTAKNHNFSLGVGVIVHNSAMELYADYSTAFSSIHNASVWVTSESPSYTRILNKFLQETIGIEERIFDWASATGGFGNLFVKLEGIPGQGIISIDDTQHPLNISRVDHKGLLVGFYQTPLGQYTGGQKLMSPWDWVHFRLLGAKKKRNPWGDESYSEFRSMYLLSGMNTLQATTRYGTSLLTNALPLYKRLRMAEDSLLLARLTRGITRYVWKLKVSGENLEAVGELVDQYATLVKRARALDTSALNPNYDSKANPMAVIEDLFVPVWGDTGDLTYDKVGGEANIRWIVDIEELRNQLACALRCPLSLLGGFVKEASGSLGSQAIEKLDIRFARSSRRLQRALRDGIKRMCQIHLAYMNMDPDPALFEVNMSETSTAEEESLRESLDAGVDTVRKMVEMLAEAVPEIDQKKVITYLNHKILKLEDFDIEQFLKAEMPEVEAEELPPAEEIEGGDADLLGEVPPEEVEGQPVLRRERKNNQMTVYNTDVLSYLPVEALTDASKKLVENFSGWLGKERGKKVWEEKFGKVTVIEETEKAEDKVGAQKTFQF